MNDLITEARDAADVLDGERMPNVADLLRRLATALRGKEIELESRTALHVECLGLVKELGDQLHDYSRQLADLHTRAGGQRLEEDACEDVHLAAA